MRVNVIIKSVLIVFAATASLTGCAKMPSPAEMAEQTKDFRLPSMPGADSAMVYVVRPSSLGTIVRFNVFLDNKEKASEMGYNRGSQYIYFPVSPGKHTIFSNAENWAEIGVEAKAGEVVFIKQEPQFGIIMARNYLVLIDETEGKYHVMTLKQGTINNKRD